MVDENFLIEKLRSEENELIKLVQDLVKIPSVNPPGDMTEISVFLKDYFNDKGLSFEVYEPKKGVITLYSKVGENGEDDFIHFNGHMDVVPIGDRNKWTVNPFGGEIIDGYLYGRGSSDMKSGLAVSIKVFEILARFWEDIPHTISLSTVPDEETGGSMGTAYLVNSLGLKPKYILIGEPSSVYRVEIGEKGIFQFTVRAEGFPVHASVSPFVGENAILKLLDVGKDICKLIDTPVDVPEELSEVVEESGKVMANYFGKPDLKKLFRSLTCNIGMIRGGDKVNIVPSWAEMDVDMRIPPGLVMTEVKNIVERILSEHEKVKLVKFSGGDPTYTDPDSPLIKSLLDASKKVLGKPVSRHLVAGGTDGRYFRRVGGDAVIYGPGEFERIHSYDERVKVDAIKIAARVELLGVYKLLSSY